VAFPSAECCLVLAQSLGAIAASIVLLVALGSVAQMGATQPLNGNWFQSLVLETVLTFILMFVILGSGLTAAPIGFAGLAIGLTVGLEAAFMGPITGASMNPAGRLVQLLSEEFGSTIGFIGLHQF